MADEPEVILEDDWASLSFARCDGPMRDEDGTLCMLEVRDSDLADDPGVRSLLLDEKGIRTLIERLQSALGPVPGVQRTSSLH